MKITWQSTAPVLSLLLTLTACGGDSSADPEETEGGANMDTDTDGSRPLESVACPFSIPAVIAGATTCYAFEAAPGIDIIATVVQGTGTERAEPLVLQNGGPGGSPWDEFAGLIASPIGDALRARHDLVIVETRGSRYTSPGLNCEAYFEASTAQLEGRADDDDINAAIETCLQGWVQEGIDLGAFDAVGLADDIARVTAGLGYERFSFLGVSFGAAIGQHLLRLYPDRLERVVLDSVVPLGTDYISEVGVNAQAAFARTADACRRDEACAANFGDLRELLDARIAQLDAEPLVLTVEAPGGGSRELQFGGDELASLVQQLLYDAESTEAIPLVLAGLESPEVGSAIAATFAGIGTYDPWAEDYVIGLSIPCHCAQVGGLDGTALERPTTEFGRRLDERDIQDNCRAMGLASLPVDANQLVATDVPVLLLAGEHDPVTPPRYAEAVGAVLSDSVVVTLSGAGHGLFPTACGLETVLGFLRDAPSSSLGTCANDGAIEFEG